MHQLVIMRGLPGSGKSTYVRHHFPHAVVCSADEFFQVDGNYQFEAALIAQAHTACQLKAIRAMASRAPLIVVDNTHCQRWEFAVVLAVAEHSGYEARIIDFFDGGMTDGDLAARNTHQVPLEAISAMRARYVT